MQQVVVISYRRFGASFRSHLQGSTVLPIPGVSRSRTVTHHKWSACSRDLHLKTRHTHSRYTSMLPSVFEPIISGERPQTDASNRSATGTGKGRPYLRQFVRNSQLIGSLYAYLFIPDFTQNVNWSETYGQKLVYAPESEIIFTKPVFTEQNVSRCFFFICCIPAFPKHFFKWGSLLLVRMFYGPPYACPLWKQIV
jgi:hypothetical protein